MKAKIRLIYIAYFVQFNTAQSPDLNIIEPLWNTLDMVRKRYPPLISKPELAMALEEEWYSIPLSTIHDL